MKYNHFSRCKIWRSYIFLYGLLKRSGWTKFILNGFWSCWWKRHLNVQKFQKILGWFITQSGYESQKPEEKVDNAAKHMVVRTSTRTSSNSSILNGGRLRTLVFQVNLWRVINSYTTELQEINFILTYLT